MSEVTGRISTALADRYRIVSHLGEGGMATVYLAEDIKHERKVAVKVLRPELAALIGADRFLHEIKLTAALQHPNILALYDSGAADSFLFYVMPYVEGESLRDRLDREKQLPVSDAVRLASQVASALDYAHRQGVVHRDIKPANVLLHDGQALVADFGIALAVSAAGGTRMTETGLSLGTPHYMSPEQASADRALDGRSDLYALGVMLYEMLAGTPPFHGASAQSIVAKILTQQAPPVSDERPTVPPHVEAAVAKALEKLPADRFDSAEAFRAALVDETSIERTTRAAAAIDADVPPVRVDRRGLHNALLPWSAAALFAAVAALAWLRPGPTALVQRYEVNGADILTSGGTAFAISPDGKTITYIGENFQVYWRPISALEAQVVPGSESSRSPFFSPDSRSIGYTTGPAADDRIRTISLDGAPPRTLAGDHFPGAAWGDDGFVYYVDIEGGLYRVSDQGGDPELLVEPGADPQLRLPEPLPGGKAVLVHGFVGGVAGETQILAFDVETRELKSLEDGTHARFAGGHLFWIREGTLFAAPFDVNELALKGQGMEVADGVRASLQGSFEYAVSETGTLIYQAGSGGVVAVPGALIGWVGEAGDAEAIDELGASGLADVDAVSLSPDGRYVALEVGEELTNVPDQPVQIWIFDFDQGSSQRLTFNGARNALPRWMPDGRHVAYISSQGDAPDGIWMQPFDRTGSDSLLVQADWPIRSFDVAAVEGVPMIVEDASGPTVDLWLATPGASEELEPYLVTDFNEALARISPDGRWVAYMSDESGRPEVYVRSFPDGGRPWPISRTGGGLPMWGHSGEEVFYMTPDPGTRLVRTRLSLGDEVRILEQTETFATEGLDIGGRGSAFYDVSGDDERILAVFNPAGIGQASDAETIVVLNLFEELKARARR